MIKLRKVSITILLFFLILISSCVEQINWSETYDHNGKEPFGTYLLYQALSSYYPQSSILYQKSNTSFEEIETNSDELLFIHVGKNFSTLDDEIDHLFFHLHNGATIFLAAENIDTLLEEQLNFNIVQSELGQDTVLTLNVPKATPIPYKVDNPFVANIIIEEEDSAYIKGFIGDKVNLTYYKYGNGHLIIHSNPKLFTNISMLGITKKYVEEVLGLLNHKKFDKVYFSSYINHDTKETDLGILWQYPAFRWAIGLLLFGIIVLLIFETKRRQAIVPIMEKNENNTKDFVETIGLLYYNEKNLDDLAAKKILYFLEFVRSKYYLDTRNLNDEFYHKLQVKSGVNQDQIFTIKQFINKLTQKENFTEQDIINLDKNIKRFNDGNT